MSSRWSTTDAPRGSDYDGRFERLAAAGHDVHGEASFVMGLRPTSVLDAGCGTGRIAIELARRGVEVVGVDLDRSMLQRACDKAPELEWYQADLSQLVLETDDGAARTFDVVLTAGNVMIFLRPGTERRTVRRLSRMVRPGGFLVSGFQLTPGQYGIDEYDRDCAAAGLRAAARFATWTRDPWTHEAGYAVSVHVAPSPSEATDDSEADAATDDGASTEPGGDD
jgi:ubiquinone/menaquinone biosynthesis C-methylase UbiE